MYDIQKKYLLIFFIAAIVFVGYWFLEGWVFSGATSHNTTSPGHISVVATSSPYILSNTYNTGSSTVLLAASPQPSNLTQQVATDLQSQFVSQLVQQGATDTPSLLSKIQTGKFQNLSDVSGQLTPSAIGIQTSINDSSLHIIDGASSSDITMYKQTYAGYLSSISAFSQVQIISALNSSFSGGDTTALDTLIQKYQNIRDGLLTMSVPRAFLSFHKENVLFFENMVIVFNALRNESTDPLSAYVALQYLPQLSSQWDVVSQDAKTIMK